MTNALISVILPIYNGADYLSDAIDSILSQNFEDFELILINDGSTDDSLSIAQAYKDPRIILISQRNMGLIATLNKGISLANGRYIARMDQDDVSFKARFSKQVELLESGYDLCGSHFHFISEVGGLSASRVVSIDPDFQSIILTRSTPFAHGSVMIRRSFLKENFLEYNKEVYSSAEDYYLWVLCFEAGARIINVNDYLFSYRYLDKALSKVNSIKNLEDANSISKYFIANNFHRIEKDIEKRLLKNHELNYFEQEQLAFYLFRTLPRRSIFLTCQYLKLIAIDIKIIAFLRVIKHTRLFLWK